MIKSVEGGVELRIQVQPRASRTELAGTIGGALKVRLAAPPVDGEANDELIRFLAKTLGVAKRAVTIVRGGTGRKKVVRVAGVDATICAQRLEVEG